MGGYTTTDLVTSIQDRMMLPDASSGSFSPAAILRLATLELQGPIASMIQAAREKYYETFADQAITANQPTYAIPSRAIGGVISVAQYVSGISIRQLPVLDPNECVTSATGTPRGFYFQNNSVVLYPTPAQTYGTLRLRYFQRPSTLEQTSNCAQVVSFDATTITATVPSAWTTTSLLDFIPQAVPYTPYSLSSAITNVSTTTITMTATPSALAIGDWVALAEYTPIPEILRELFPVLSQATVCRILEAQGATEKLPAAMSVLSAYIQAAKIQIAPRDVYTPKVVRSNWRAL